MTDANRNQQEIDYNIDREEIEMELDENETPVTVTDIPSPDGLEDASEFELPAMAPGMGDGPSLDELMSFVQAMMGASLSPEDDLKIKALEVLMPVIDAGVDIMAMEGAAKNGGELTTVDGQFSLRGELVDGILDSLEVFGVEKRQVFHAMERVQATGFRFKQGEDGIADRLTVFDRVSLINLLYGPKLAGVILTAQTRTQVETENENARED